ncbi:hypothetical protein FR483_n154L [Paramecium bursaria Chlorella virus FR483]|uniref:Uncharacterized protein n154L n=1 Tax=Paramecium bursaria Chlorella virus FR483 TaxID=399781 RepID=A7J6K8_PBCVF|nr:hypothetical protein FR483_n154L [Paramecium bursaria Chlorella virus FR483]ABT15439.1 hypothetical protein FR483_n154L [Paramecium bursaria Chlorella virus FR483]
MELENNSWYFPLRLDNMFFYFLYTILSPTLDCVNFKASVKEGLLHSKCLLQNPGVYFPALVQSSLF